MTSNTDSCPYCQGTGRVQEVTGYGTICIGPCEHCHANVQNQQSFEQLKRRFEQEWSDWRATDRQSN
ncbi:hypothetical protein IWT25_02323 [Secundilactobacillus pentosiphilus]|uniref:Uncharacterized protein n=1 Tax=Secundilactobacillus pentosiphilus TaxID=1714682 RepID=A0A1Z5IYW1_9LACO|nr:hypothetical protein IWT25_02323 [Secundilactobacillus pentosiphilus]